MVCGCVLHRGERCGVFRRLCVGMVLGWEFYWFEVGRGCDVFLLGGGGGESSEGEICICVEFAEICCYVTVSGCVSMLVV